jgi:hypothetical protein
MGILDTIKEKAVKAGMWVEDEKVVSAIPSAIPTTPSIAPSTYGAAGTTNEELLAALLSTVNSKLGVDDAFVKLQTAVAKAMAKGQSEAVAVQSAAAVLDLEVGAILASLDKAITIINEEKASFTQTDLAAAIKVAEGIANNVAALAAEIQQLTDQLAAKSDELTKLKAAQYQAINDTEKMSASFDATVITANQKLNLEKQKVGAFLGVVK